MRKKDNPLDKDKKLYKGDGLLMKETKDIVLEDIMKELNFIERIIVRIFSKIFIKVYNETRIKIVNSMLK